MIVNEKDYEHLTLLEKARAWRRAVFATYRDGQPKDRLVKFLDDVEKELRRPRVSVMEDDDDEVHQLIEDDET